MKPKSKLRSLLALASSTLLTINYVSAGTYYWDSDGDATLGFGSTSGTWDAAGTGNLWSTSPTGDGVGGAAVADYMTTIADDLFFGTGLSLTSAATISGAGTVTCDSTANLKVGMTVTGTGIPASTKVASITDSTTFELSANATATNTGLTLSATFPLGGAVTIAGTVNANSIHTRSTLLGTTPTINFSATGSYETSQSTGGFQAGTSLTGAGTSMTWIAFNNINITAITSNSAGSTILQSSPENTTAPGKVVMNAEVNLGIANAPLVFDGGGVRMTSGFPYADLNALHTAHPVTFTLNKNALLDNSTGGSTFTVNMPVNLGTGVFFTDTGGSGGASPIKLTSSLNTWNEVRISTGLLEIDNLNQLGTTTLAAEAPLRFGSGFTSGSGGTLRIVGTGVTSFGTRSMLTTPGKLVAFDIADAGNTFTVNQLLDQTTGGLTKAGPGTLIINTTSSYTGTTTLSGGTLNFGTALGLPTAAVTVNGADALLQFDAYNPSVGVVTLTNGSVTGSGTLTSNAAFALNGAAGTVVNVGIKLAGTLGLTKSAVGTATLSADNSGLSGPVTVSSGVLNINSTTALGSGAVTISGGTIDATSGPITLSTNNVIALGGGNFSFGGTTDLNFGTGAITNNNSRTITLNGTGSILTFGGEMTNTLANNQTTTVNGPGNTLVLGGYAIGNPTVNNNRTGTINGSGNVTITGAVTNGVGGATACLLTKSGTGTLTLQGTNTYTGATTVNTGGCLALVGGSQSSVITVNSGAKLGFTLGSPTTSSAACNLQTGHAIRITGTPTLASYTLITAASIGGTGVATPTLETPIPGYELDVVGTTLVLKSLSTPYQDWATGGELFNDDANGDGVKNGLAFLLGAATPSENAIGKLPTVTESGGGLVLTFNCLPLANRGTAVLSVEQSSDLGILDPWGAAAVPDANGGPVNGISFVVGAGPLGPPALNSITVTISPSEAAAGKLFGRLKATEP